MGYKGRCTFSLGAIVLVWIQAASAAKTSTGPACRPTIGRHYPHIRLYAAALSGTPLGRFEDRLLKESLDAVMANPKYAEHIYAAAPQTPQLVYTNASSLYDELLLDWFSYADERKLSREAAFYHASHETPFSGDSPSSKPVNWFWGVFRENGLDCTTSAHGNRSKGVSFPPAGGLLHLGYVEPFREINISLRTAAGPGWTGVWEFSSVGVGQGSTGWSNLTPISDETKGLRQSGRITFDPPAEWRAATVGRSARLYYVRCRAVAGGTPPIATSIFGRDYVRAQGKASGIIPAFDAAADVNGDGYLSDKEFAAREHGKDARFLYESRMFTRSYGQMRFATNPGSPDYRRWVIDYHVRLAKKNRLAGGFFMDNSEGKPPVDSRDVAEPIKEYAQDYGRLLADLGGAIAPRWILANTAGGWTQADAVIRSNPAYWEESAIRPLFHTHGQFEDFAKLLARRAQLASPPPLAFLDSNPMRADGGKPNPLDPRLQMATLAYYYLIADPENTFLAFFQGWEAAGSWTRHWVPAAAHDVGKPRSSWSVFAKGNDPSNGKLEFRVYQRPYERALVLYKPVSFGGWKIPRGQLGDETQTAHELGGHYRPLMADNTLGPSVSRLTLRNGEGAILLPVDR